MTSDLDIWRSAGVMIREHGDRAASAASLRALQRLDAGDEGAAAVWRQIVRAIEQLQADAASTVH